MLKLKMDLVGEVNSSHNAVPYMIKEPNVTGPVVLMDRFTNGNRVVENVSLKMNTVLQIK